MTKLTALQQAFIDTMSGDTVTPEQVRQALLNGELYADAIDTSCGGMSTGSISVDDESNVPALYVTREEAEADVNGERERYLNEIADGERDDDDEYEGDVYRVYWDGTDTLHFFTPDAGSGTDTTDAVAQQTCARAMGE
jgi:hypothetical protein